MKCKCLYGKLKNPSVVTRNQPQTKKEENILPGRPRWERYIAAVGKTKSYGLAQVVSASRTADIQEPGAGARHHASAFRQSPVEGTLRKDYSRAPPRNKCRVASSWLGRFFHDALRTAFFARGGARACFLIFGFHFLCFLFSLLHFSPYIFKFFIWLSFCSSHLCSSRSLCQRWLL